MPQFISHRIQIKRDRHLTLLNTKMPLTYQDKDCRCLLDTLAVQLWCFLDSIDPWDISRVFLHLCSKIQQDSPDTCLCR